MRRLVLLGIGFAAAVVAGCGAGATTNCRTPPDRALLLAVRAHAGPITLPGGEKQANAAQLTISACQTSDTEATATLTVFGLRDDSIRDMRHGLKLERGGDAWRVVADSHTQRCQKGRGSSEFASAKCT